MTVDDELLFEGVTTDVSDFPPLEVSSLAKPIPVHTAFHAPEEYDPVIQSHDEVVQLIVHQEFDAHVRSSQLITLHEITSPEEVTITFHVLPWIRRTTSRAP